MSGRTFFVTKTKHSFAVDAKLFIVRFFSVVLCGVNLVKTVSAALFALTRDQCYNFENIFAKNWQTHWRFSLKIMLVYFLK
jgi:hypothetical protein